MLGRPNQLAVRQGVSAFCNNAGGPDWQINNTDNNNWITSIVTDYFLLSFNTQLCTYVFLMYTWDYLQFKFKMKTNSLLDKMFVKWVKTSQLKYFTHCWKLNCAVCEYWFFFCLILALTHVDSLRLIKGWNPPRNWMVWVRNQMFLNDYRNRRIVSCLTDRRWESEYES